MITATWLLIGVFNANNIIDTHKRFTTKKECLLKKKTVHIHQSVDLLNREPKFECVRLVNE